MNQPTPKQVASFDQAEATFTEELARLASTYRALKVEKGLSHEQAASWIRALIADPDGPFKEFERETFAGLVAIAVTRLVNQP